MTKETYAARALLAYHNFGLARRLARKVFLEATPEAKKKVAAAIMELVPEAVRGTTWPQVQAFVLKVGHEYVASPGFAAKAQRIIDANVDRWLGEAIDGAISNKARAMVETYLKTYDGSQFVKTIPGRVQAAVEAEIKLAAQHKVKEVHP
jgi:hypothetical protein